MKGIFACNLSYTSSLSYSLVDGLISIVGFERAIFIEIYIILTIHLNLCISFDNIFQASLQKVRFNKIQNLNSETHSNMIIHIKT